MKKEIELDWITMSISMFHGSFQNYKLEYSFRDWHTIMLFQVSWQSSIHFCVYFLCEIRFQKKKVGWDLILIYWELPWIVKSERYLSNGASRGFRRDLRLSPHQAIPKTQRQTHFLLWSKEMYTISPERCIKILIWKCVNLKVKLENKKDISISKKLYL